MLTEAQHTKIVTTYRAIKSSKTDDMANLMFSAMPIFAHYHLNKMEDKYINDRAHVDIPNHCHLRIIQLLGMFSLEADSSDVLSH